MGDEIKEPVKIRRVVTLTADLIESINKRCVVSGREFSAELRHMLAYAEWAPEKGRKP